MPLFEIPSDLIIEELPVLKTRKITILVANIDYPLPAWRIPQDYLESLGKTYIKEIQSVLVQTRYSGPGSSEKKKLLGFLHCRAIYEELCKIISEIKRRENLSESVLEKEALKAQMLNHEEYIHLVSFNPDSY